MENGTKIQYIKEYQCGYCINNEKHMYKGHGTQKVHFPARVLVVKHVDYGYLLVDTGYSEKVYENGWISKLYHLINPTFFKKEDSLAYQLQQDGIALSDIKHVIITHLHPDHIGALETFSQAKWYGSQVLKEDYANQNPLKVIFKNMINGHLLAQIEAVEAKKERPANDWSRIFGHFYDLFGDKSIGLVPLPGHTKGQMGVVFPEYQLFFIADASWNSKQLGYTLRLLPRLIQRHYKTYKRTQTKIIKLMEKMPQVQVVASHDPFKGRGNQGGRVWEND